MANVMKTADFEEMFAAALSDKKFQKEMQSKGFKALDDRGYLHGVPPKLQKDLEAALFTKQVGTTARRPRCGVCGVCGVCGLCGGANAGSASAALWALFALSN